MPKKTTTDVIGLDFGSSTIKVCVLRDGFPLVVAYQPLPEGAIVRGQLRDTDVVVASLKELWQREQIGSNDVLFTFSSEEGALRTMTVPNPGEKEDLELAVKTNFSYVMNPIDPKISEWDFSEIRRVERTLYLAVSAGPADEIAAYSEACAKAGLNPIGAELSATAMARAIQLPESAAEVYAVIDIGAELTSVSVATGNGVYFSRSIPLGGNDFTRACQEVEGYADWDSAELLKRNVHIDHIDSAAGIDPIAATEAANRMISVADLLIQQITDSLAFYDGMSDSLPIMGMVITGGGSKMLWLREQIGEFLFGGAAEDPSPRPQMATVPDFVSYATAVGTCIEHRISLMPTRGGVLGIKLPAKKRRPQKVRTRKPISTNSIPTPVLAGMFAIVLVFAASFFFGAGYRSQTANLQGQIDQLGIQAAAASTQGALIVASERYKARHDQAVSIARNRKAWGDELALIRKVIDEVPGGNTLFWQVSDASETVLLYGSLSENDEREIRQGLDAAGYSAIDAQAPNGAPFAIALRKTGGEE